MLKKVSGGFKATSEKGRPLSKKPKSKQGALAQLYAVEMSQARRRAGKGKKGKVSKKARKGVAQAVYDRYA